MTRLDSPRDAISGIPCAGLGLLRLVLQVRPRARAGRSRLPSQCAARLPRPAGPGRPCRYAPRRHAAQPDHVLTRTWSDRGPPRAMSGGRVCRFEVAAGSDLLRGLGRLTGRTASETRPVAIPQGRFLFGQFPCPPPNEPPRRKRRPQAVSGLQTREQRIQSVQAKLTIRQETMNVSSAESLTGGAGHRPPRPKWSRTAFSQVSRLIADQRAVKPVRKISSSTPAPGLRRVQRGSARRALVAPPARRVLSMTASAMPPRRREHGRFVMSAPA